MLLSVILQKHNFTKQYQYPKQSEKLCDWVMAGKWLCSVCCQHSAEVRQKPEIRRWKSTEDVCDAAVRLVLLADRMREVFLWMLKNLKAILLTLAPTTDTSFTPICNSNWFVVFYFPLHFKVCWDKKDLFRGRNIWCNISKQSISLSAELWYV